MEAENIEVYSYLFDMKWHVIAKHSNIIVVKKLLVDEKNNSLCEANMSPGCFMQSFE